MSSLCRIMFAPRQVSDGPMATAIAQVPEIDLELELDEPRRLTPFFRSVFKGIPPEENLTQGESRACWLRC